MSDNSRLSFRLSPALQAALASRVRHDHRVSDVIREALEAYLEVRPPECPPAPGVPDTVSDMLSDIARRLEALMSDMADLRERLTRLEARERQASLSRARPT